LQGKRNHGAQQKRHHNHHPVKALPHTSTIVSQDRQSLTADYHVRLAPAVYAAGRVVLGADMSENPEPARPPLRERISCALAAVMFIMAHVWCANLAYFLVLEARNLGLAITLWTAVGASFLFVVAAWRNWSGNRLTELIMFIAMAGILGAFYTAVVHR
jgi:hypothetical protein